MRDARAKCVRQKWRFNRLPIRYPCYSHAVAGAFEPGKVSRIVARCVRAKPMNCEIRIERQSSLRFGPRLIQLAKPSQGGPEPEMPDGIVPGARTGACPSRSQCPIGVNRVVLTAAGVP